MFASRLSAREAQRTMVPDNADVFWGELSPCDHVLQIYDNDRVLLSTLAGFV